MGTKLRLSASLCALGIALAAALGIATPALAVTFSSEVPTGPIHAQPTYAGVDVYSARAIDSRYVKIKIDGTAYTTLLTSKSTGHWLYTETLDPATGIYKASWVYIAQPADSTRALVYSYPVFATPLGDGVHTVIATVRDTAGVNATDTWTFVLGQPPAFGTPVPAANSTVATRTPAISIPVSDNGPGALTPVVTINGAPVSATVSGGSVRVAATTLPNDATATISVKVTDASGTSNTKTWSFYVEVYADMFSSIGSCTDCHHNDAIHSGMVPGLGWSYCSRCHSTNPHTGTPTSMHTRADVSGCAGCHVSDITVEHSRWLATGGAAITCLTCHQSANSAVVSAISSGNSQCIACHPGAGDHSAKHDTTVSASCSGAACHSGTNLLPIHTSLTCLTCHASANPTVLGAIAAHDKNCTSCHSVSSPHPDLSTLHAFPSDKSDCLAAGCHDATAITPFAGKTVDQLHSLASTTTPSGTRTSCRICHVAGTTPTKDCTASGCHPDRALPHGYVPSLHMADATCVQGCHTNIAGMTELMPLHQIAAPGITCATCHASLVASIKPWDKTCSACHPADSLHPNAAASHVGTDTVYALTSTLQNGCSNATSGGYVGWGNCHDISNVSALHAGMADGGCPVCHGPGKTPSKECGDCHQTGGSTSYTKVTSWTEGTATIAPATDASISPAWSASVITSPTGQARYAVVNAAYPPADTTRYVTVTTNVAGGMLFGFNRPTIPADAHIKQVTIWAKAKAANTTYPRKLQGWFGVGGRTYLSGTLSANLPSASWLGAGGPGQFFNPAVTDTDYTRDVVYGESVSANPKTDVMWQPADINGLTANSIDSFGVWATASTAANNVQITQVYLTVSYFVPVVSPWPTVGTHVYHFNNPKYLNVSTDATPGQLWVPDPPAHGWNDALTYQDCYDFCHRSMVDGPVYSALHGTWMWYSVGGDPYNPYLATRTLTLKPVAIPSDSPRLTFSTNYDMTTAQGYVEISTNGGSSWTTLTGTIAGTPASVLTGKAASGWSAATYDLSAYAGQTAKLRFRYVNNDSTGAGWGLDDIAVLSNSTTVFSDDAETLKPDWTNSYWTRSMGAFSTY